MFRPRSRVLIATLVASALSAATPATGEAQFAGVPRVPRRRPPAESAAAAGGSAHRDTLPPTRLPDMKAWVDSATIALGSAGAAGRTTSPATTPPPPAGRPPRGRRGADSTMREGARAPDTATPLPTVALAGALLLAVGLLLRRRASAPRG